MGTTYCDFSDLPSDQCSHCDVATTTPEAGQRGAGQAAVRREALALMAQYGLIELGWTFAFDRPKTRLGLCNHSLKRITISKHWAEALPIERLRNTILHEIAHSLVGPGNGHNHVWRRQALAIWCTGEKCSNTDGVRLERAWVGTCPTCNGKTETHGAPRRVRACGRCCHGRFNPDHILTWTNNGSPVKMGPKYSNELNAIKLKAGFKDAMRASAAN